MEGPTKERWELKEAYDKDMPLLISMTNLQSYVLCLAYYFSIKINIITGSDYCITKDQSLVNYEKARYPSKRALQ